MPRRGLLTLGLVSAAVLAVGGGVPARVAPGLQDGQLSPRGREVIAGIGRAVLAARLMGRQVTLA